MRFEIDKNTAAVFGFSEAGWSDLRKKLCNDGREVFTTIDDLLPATVSIYQKYHSPQLLECKSKIRKKEPKSVQAALETLGVIFQGIQDQQTRSNFLRFFVDKVYTMTEEEYLSAIKSITEAQSNEDKNTTLLEILCDLSPSKIENSIEDVNLTGYGLASVFRVTRILQDCCVNQDAALVANLKRWSDYADLSESTLHVQLGLAQSKGLIVDVVQLNLDRLLKHETLMPIYFSIASDTHHFSPAWYKATQKIGNFYTLAEVRMIYKLMVELGDALITTMLKNTVFFMRKTAMGFIQMPMPWDENITEWKERTRSRNKAAYMDRQADELPEWIRELRALSCHVATSLSDTTALCLK